MPPKAKRYIVQVFDPLLSTWRNISGPLTTGDATKLMGMIMWDARKVETF
jgi:hypothetical protein